MSRAFSVLFLFVVVALLFVRRCKKVEFCNKTNVLYRDGAIFWYFYSFSAESFSNSGL